MEKLVFFASGIGLGLLVCLWISRRAFLSEATHFQKNLYDKQIECDYLIKEYLLEVSRAIAAEYIERDEEKFTGMMRDLKRDYSRRLTEQDLTKGLQGIARDFPDIKDFSLADTLTCVSPTFRFADVSNEELSERFREIMRYLRLRFEYEDIESVEYWIAEQRERQEERALAAEVDRVKRAFDAQTRDHTPKQYFDYQVGVHYISSNDVPFGVEYTFLPDGVRQDFDSEDWYLLGWEVSMPEEREYVRFFKRIGGAKGRDIWLTG